MNFFVPGSATSAFTRGFGVVFSDVDLADTTSLSFFDVNDNLLGQFFVDPFPGDETFSFIGVLFNAGEQVARVRIVSGSQALAPGSTVDNDLVAMDDFIYAEPLARVVPEPGVLVLLAPARSPGVAALAELSRDERATDGPARGPSSSARRYGTQATTPSAPTPSEVQPALRMIWRIVVLVV